MASTAADDVARSRTGLWPTPDRPDEQSVRPPWWDRRAVDGAVAVVLLVLGALIRRAGLPTDGLWYDDAWVATGASKGGPADLLTVSTNHPGFTALMMAWARISARSELMVWPAFVAGVLGPPVTYLALRRWRVAAPIAGSVCAGRFDVDSGAGSECPRRGRVPVDGSIFRQ